MSSVIKNPMILQSANYIYNWFIAINNKNNKLIKNSNLLESIESDEVVLKNLKKNKKNNEDYKNIEERLKKLEQTNE